MPLKNQPPATGPEWISADTINPRDIRWLWYPYIPYGAVTAIYGRGGIGKSQVTCSIAAAISQGHPLPGEAERSNGNHGPKNVLMLSAEDDYEEVLIPRLLGMGANLSNIMIPKKRWTLDVKGIGFLADAITKYAVATLFIDPIVYYAGGKMDINKANEVRAMMEKLRETVHGTKSAIIIVGHTRKNQEGHEADLMMGSADWINASRSALFATETNDGTRILKHAKSNYGPKGKALSYLLGPGGFEWGEMYDECDLPTEKRGKRVSQAVSFLQFFLEKGPMPSKELERAAHDAEIAPATLNRAKIGVAESYYSKSQKCWMWRLIEDGL